MQNTVEYFLGNLNSYTKCDKWWFCDTGITKFSETMRNAIRMCDFIWNIENTLICMLFLIAKINWMELLTIRMLMACSFTEKEHHEKVTRLGRKRCFHKQAKGICCKSELAIPSITKINTRQKKLYNLSVILAFVSKIPNRKLWRCQYIVYVVAPRTVWIRGAYLQAQ